MIRGDIMAMSFDVARAKPLFDPERERFKQFFTAQARVRGLVGRDDHRPRHRDHRARRHQVRPADRRCRTPPGLATVNETEPQIGMLLSTNSVAAVVKLRGYDNAYLSIIRPLDPRVVAQLRETQATVSDFANLQARRFGVQLAFALMYTVIALAVLLSAAWLGLNFANRLVAPIRRLIGAANIVSTGNLYVQVPVLRSEGDLAQLGETFNRMTYELRTQRDDIVRARDLIDQRRRFTEAVLAGASAGVIGVDGEGRISILNRSAEKLIDRLRGRRRSASRSSEIVPELKEIFANAQLGTQRLVQGQVTINRQNRERNLSVRVTTEQSPDARARLCHHARRHHRAGDRAAHLGLGRHRAPHRPRDQEPADADPAFGRAAAAQVRQVDHRGPGRLRAVHRHDRAPGRRHQAHGRRVLEVRPHAEGRDRGRGRRRHGAPGGVPACASATPTSTSSWSWPRTRCRRASTAG